MYYRTYRLSPNRNTAAPSWGEIGLAISTDGGASFNLYNSGFPVVSRGSSCSDWDYAQAIAPSVVRVDSTHWYMVYEGSSSNVGCPAFQTNLGSVGWAFSTDGLTWAKNGILLKPEADWETGDPSFPIGNIGTPFIGYFNQKFYVYYHGYNGARSQIGFASGPDMSSLTKYGSPVIHNPDVDHWDWYVDSRASIVQEGSFYYMTFEGSGSTDCSTGDWGWGIARTTNLDTGVWDKYVFNPIRQTYKGGCGNDLPYIFSLNGVDYVYQREQGNRNVLLTGYQTSGLSGSDTVVQDAYLYVWRAYVQCQAYHKVGYLDGVAWAAATGNGQGHMCYGPYVVLPNGHYEVSFRAKEDVVQCSYCVNVINNEVYDSSTGSSVLLVDINRPDLLVPDTYNSLNYQFCASGVDQYEFRTWYYNTALIHQDSVFVRWLASGSDCRPSGGGGGGSIAYGSLISMKDGSKVPVQNLKVGDMMLGYDTDAGTYAISVANAITIVVTTNMLIIHTSDGTPFRVDANQHQTLWVKTAAGSIGWVPVTQIKIGDDLFTQNGWVPVTTIEFAPAGHHVMYDIVASVPYFADGYLDPIYKV